MDLEGDSAISLQGYTSLHTFRSHQTNFIHGLEITHSSGQLNVSGNPVIPTLSQLALYSGCPLEDKGQHNRFRLKFTRSMASSGYCSTFPTCRTSAKETHIVRSTGKILNLTQPGCEPVLP
ncbi:UNVERIFIED_CONTAM: hypothetical protein FKN15_034240 [Acipenser sinensis]